MAQFVRPSDYNSEDLGSNPGWISMSFFPINNNSANKTPFQEKPGKWRLILNLCSAEGHSVNDGIAKDL